MHGQTAIALSVTTGAGTTTAAGPMTAAIIIVTETATLDNGTGDGAMTTAITGGHIAARTGTIIVQAVTTRPFGAIITGAGASGFLWDRPFTGRATG